MSLLLLLAHLCVALPSLAFPGPCRDTDLFSLFLFQLWLETQGARDGNATDDVTLPRRHAVPGLGTDTGRVLLQKKPHKNSFYRQLSAHIYLAPGGLSCNSLPGLLFNCSVVTCSPEHHVFDSRDTDNRFHSCILKLSRDSVFTPGKVY